MIGLAATATQRCPDSRLIFVLLDIGSSCCSLKKRHHITYIPLIRFSGVDITMWIQYYIRAERDIVRALMKLSKDGDLMHGVIKTLSSLVCFAYCPKSNQIASIPDLRWHVFCKHLAESGMLPPATGALEEHIEDVRVQSRICSQATVNSGSICLTHSNMATNKSLPAPHTIVELVRCQCKENCSTQLCSCRKLTPTFASVERSVKTMRNIVSDTTHRTVMTESE